MSGPRISSVELVKDGLVICYEDSTCAFYHQSVFTAHLNDQASGKPAKKSSSRPRSSAGSLKLPVPPG